MNCLQEADVDLVVCGNSLGQKTGQAELDLEWLPAKNWWDLLAVVSFAPVVAVLAQQLRGYL